MRKCPWWCLKEIYEELWLYRTISLRTEPMQKFDGPFLGYPLSLLISFFRKSKFLHCCVFVLIRMYLCRKTKRLWNASAKLVSGTNIARGHHKEYHDKGRILERGWRLSDGDTSITRAEVTVESFSLFKYRC